MTKQEKQEKRRIKKIQRKAKIISFVQKHAKGVVIAFLACIFAVGFIFGCFFGSNLGQRSGANDGVIKASAEGTVTDPPENSLYVIDDINFVQINSCSVVYDNIVMTFSFLASIDDGVFGQFFAVRQHATDLSSPMVFLSSVVIRYWSMSDFLETIVDNDFELGEFTLGDIGDHLFPIYNQDTSLSAECYFRSSRAPSSGSSASIDLRMVYSIGSMRFSVLWSYSQSTLVFPCFCLCPTTIDNYDAAYFLSSYNDSVSFALQSFYIRNTELAYNNAYSAGESAGYQSGYESGTSSGYTAGYAAGLVQGAKDQEAKNSLGPLVGCTYDMIITYTTDGTTDKYQTFPNLTPDFSSNGVNFSGFYDSDAYKTFMSGLAQQGYSDITFYTIRLKFAKPFVFSDSLVSSLPFGYNLVSGVDPVNYIAITTESGVSFRAKTESISEGSSLYKIVPLTTLTGSSVSYIDFPIFDHYYRGENGEQLRNSFTVYYSLSDQYILGLQAGSSAGYNNGFKAGEKKGYTSGKADGYNQGYDVGLNQSNSFLSLFVSVIDAPVKVFSSLFDVEILGYNMKNLCFALLSACLVLAVFRFFSGRK